MSISYEGKYFNIYKNQKSYRQINERSTEFRGVWVTTVRNTDFPSPSLASNGFNIEDFKKEYRDILETCKKYKLNTIIFQVRPEGDALYPSAFSPWSKYLTGVQGKSPTPSTFNPLSYLIEKTHEANIEFHAWINPYRLTSITNKFGSKEEAINSLSSNHFAKANPNTTYLFNGQLFFDPGSPDVLNLLVNIVTELISNYNVDAIHFDDYFYPYPFFKDGKTIHFRDLAPDYQTFINHHTKDTADIEIWRENNINRLIYAVNRTIKAYNLSKKKAIQFGISPFGIWSSLEESSGGSKTSPHQLSSLEEYVNTKLWIDSEWIDYVIPQVYWSFEDSLSPFDIVAKWWNDVVEHSNVKLYIGLGLYLYEEDSKWSEPDEIIEQLKLIRNLSHVSGFAFFTYHNFVKKSASNSNLEKALVLLESKI